MNIQEGSIVTGVIALIGYGLKQLNDKIKDTSSDAKDATEKESDKSEKGDLRLDQKITEGDHRLDSKIEQSEARVNVGLEGIRQSLEGHAASYKANDHKIFDLLKDLAVHVGKVETKLDLLIDGKIKTE